MKGKTDEEKFEHTKERYKKTLLGLKDKFEKVKSLEEYKMAFEELLAAGKKMRAENPKALDELYDYYTALINAQLAAESRVTGKPADRI